MPDFAHGDLGVRMRHARFGGAHETCQIWIYKEMLHVGILTHRTSSKSF